MATSGDRAASLWPIPTQQRPGFRWSDIWMAPLHDLPVRDEILYQYLPLAPEMEVLEVGPGGGFTAFRLARRVRRLTLVDVAERSITHLRAVLAGVPNLSFACQDVCADGMADALGGKFDAAYAIEVFELLPDPARCLKNFATLLRAGGTLLLQFPNYPPPKNPGPTYFRTRADLDRLFREAGFQQWAVYSLKLRPLANLLYRQLHERPLQLYRRLRGENGGGRPLVYDDSWAFQHRGRLHSYKIAFHGAWEVLSAGMRLAGPCFEHTLLGDDILHHNLMVLARR